MRSISMWLAAALAPCLYLLINYQHIVNRIPYIDDPTPLDIVMAVLSVVPVLEGTRRVIGLALPITALVLHRLCAAVHRCLGSIGMLDQMYLTTERHLRLDAGRVGGFVDRSSCCSAASWSARARASSSWISPCASPATQAGGPGKVSVVSS